ncbi:hypothetical protein WBJ53_07255 [Spirosoma sp. SC4-14]|uniref:hypothetical protein n=1 Tax=Spirosoma sp. SC4-14 TaxID=3128900 RepID=UPI0030D3733B
MKKVLANFSEGILSRDQMKKVQGGTPSLTGGGDTGGTGGSTLRKYTCSCTQGAGTWYYPKGQPSLIQVSNDIAKYCNGAGGSCAYQ